MLAAAQRLRRSNDFAAAVRGGRRAGRGTVVVHVLLDEPVQTGSSDSPARAGFVVSKAVGNAVTRNRVRRRLRHAVATRLDALPEGSRTVVRVLPGAATAGYAALRAALDQALDRSLRAGQRTGSS